MIACAINGFFSMGLFSVVFEMCVEQTFPVGEATSNGFINTLSNLFGFCLSIGLTAVLNGGD